MPHGVFQSIVAPLRKALRLHFPAKAALIPGAAMLVPVPLLAEAPVPLDGSMFALLGVLGVAAGVAVGVLFRRMKGEEEALRTQLQHTEGELRALLTMSDEAVLVLDGDGRVRTTNPAAEELFGLAADDLLGEPLDHLLEHPLSLGDLTRHGPANFTGTALRAGGEKLTVEILLAPTQLQGTSRYVALVHEQKTIAAPMPAPAVALPPASIAEPVAKHCHDLNNLLTGITGNLSLMLMAQIDPGTHERAVAAKKTALRAQETVKKIHILARAEPLVDAAPMPLPVPGTIVQMPSLRPSVDASPRPAATRVLIVDDEEAICSLVATTLDAMGCEVTEATHSEVAFRACKQALADSRPFHLVIADLTLPGDLSGQEIVARLREMDPSLRAIVSSGHDGDPIMTRYREHGFVAAIAKPYEVAKLGRVVREALEPAPSGARRTA